MAQPVQEVTVMAPAERDPKLEPPFTVRPVVVALPEVKLPKAVRLLTFKEPKLAPPVTPNEVEVPTLKDNEPSEVPPFTVRPVVVAFPAVIFPKAERLVTLIAPKLAPPVTDSEVEVPAPKTNDPKLVPPVTVSPVVVAFCMFAPTPQFVEVADTENKVEVPDWPLI